MSNAEEPKEPAKLTGPRQRTQIISSALAEAARRSRFSARTRRRMTPGGGFAARRGRLLIRIYFIVTFIVLVALPSLIGGLYYGFFASDQYIAEARFAIRSGEIPTLDGLGALSGLAAMTIVQDTQIVANYIYSRAMVEQLEKQVNLRQLYAHSDVDWYARFNPMKPVEKFVNYWKSMADVTISMPSGIVLVIVRAFRPEDTVTIVNAVLEQSEQLVNSMNERLRRDSVTSAEQEFTRAMQRLSMTRTRLEQGRNAEGMLDASQTATSMNLLLSSVEGELLRLRQEYDTQLRYVSDQAPQMRALKSRITATSAQLDQLRARITSQSAKPNERVLSESFTKFSELDLEHQIAEKQYATAAATLELARAGAERKQVYLSTFVRPAVPEEPRYPKRGLYPLYIILSALTLWGMSCGAATAIRNYMA